MSAKPTDAQKLAARWLYERNGDGLFDRNSVLVAAGERAPFMRMTWNALRDLGLGEFYGGTTGRGRFKLTAAGSALAAQHPTFEGGSA